jgi:hypothetical protein
MMIPPPTPNSPDRMPPSTPPHGSEDAAGGHDDTPVNLTLPNQRVSSRETR